MSVELAYREPGAGLEFEWAGDRQVSVPGDSSTDMPDRIRRRGRRTPTQVAADRRADDVATYLGRSLKDARRMSRMPQAEVSSIAGVSRSLISEMERGHGADVTLLVWTRVARAARSDLRAYLERATATDQPRDAVHLRAQELIVRTAAIGGWRAQPERAIDLDPARSRAGDVVLTREEELALVEAFDWLDDVGDAFRSWDRRLATVEQRAIALAPLGTDATTLRTAGIWVLRATRTNRRLVADHRALFQARFPGSGAAWLRALSDPAHPMPQTPALLWISVTGDRLYPARLVGPKLVAGLSPAAGRSPRAAHRGSPARPDPSADRPPASWP
jgi:transcriptional regulator with XRE-family HTH domain